MIRSYCKAIPYEQIVRFIKHYLKEILIALILAVIAAYAYEDLYKNWKHKHTIQINKKAVATVIVFDKEGKPFGQGSGVFINADGLLVTNFHVIKGADISRTMAKLSTGAQYSLKRFKGVNRELDIALLQFDGIETPCVNFGDSDKLWTGQKVLAIGTPMGQENSVSEGIIADPAREISGLKFIQFTAPISPGSSGGGLFNEHGEAVIGITCAVFQDEARKAQNINFAIPINFVKSVLAGSEGKLVEGSADFYYSLGQIEENKENIPKAVEYYLKAISVDNKYADAYMSLGGILYDQGKYDLEVESYRKAVEINPDKCENVYYLGTAYEDNQQYDKAIEAYEKALFIKPDHKDTLHDFAILSIAIRDCERANKLISKLKELDRGQARKLELIKKTACP